VLTPQEIEMIKGLASRLGASPDKEHEVNDLQSSGIEELADAVKALMSAMSMLSQKVEELCTDYHGFKGQGSAFIDNWERMAKDKSRDEGMKELEGKYGANEEYGRVAKVFHETEGENIFAVIYDLLMEARESADEAEEASEQAEFDEDGFVKNIFGAVGGKISKVAELAAPKAVEVEIEKKPEAEPAKAEEVKVEETKKPTLVQQIRNSKRATA
jgi:hypothetical protein